MTNIYLYKLIMYENITLVYVNTSLSMNNNLKKCINLIKV